MYNRQGWLKYLAKHTILVLYKNILGKNLSLFSFYYSIPLKVPYALLPFDNSVPIIKKEHAAIWNWKFPDFFGLF